MREEGRSKEGRKDVAAAAINARVIFPLFPMRRRRVRSAAIRWPLVIARRRRCRRARFASSAVGPGLQEPATAAAVRLWLCLSAFLRHSLSPLPPEFITQSNDMNEYYVRVRVRERIYKAPSWQPQLLLGVPIRLMIQYHESLLFRFNSFEMIDFVHLYCWLVGLAGCLVAHRERI